MQNNDQKNAWEAYKSSELARLTPVLESLGYSLSEVQPHISGERYLMSGKKLVLMGERREGKTPVVIKASSDESGMREIESEYKARITLDKLKFAYYSFRWPKEILCTRAEGLLILITEYVSQDSAFLKRPLAEQFYLVLRSFKTQEGVHATTSSHARAIRKIFGIWGAREYMDSFDALVREIGTYAQDTSLDRALFEAREFLLSNRETIERYSGFLTHTDFVPHNLRVHDHEIYLLDHTSLRFGNKYEGLARFLNFMLLYNRPLEEALVSYVRDNRSEGELLSLRLMRAYKIAFLLSFYAKNLSKTSGELRLLTQKRIAFWSAALSSIIKDAPLPEEVIAQYKEERDSLRSPEEKERQQNLH
jgi:hypothetical protein